MPSLAVDTRVANDGDAGVQLVERMRRDRGGDSGAVGVRVRDNLPATAPTRHPRSQGQRI